MKIHKTGLKKGHPAMALKETKKKKNMSLKLKKNKTINPIKLFLITLLLAAMPGVQT